MGRHLYFASEIDHVHLEPTTRCNAACPMCARNLYGRTAPELKQLELSEENVRLILPAEFLAHVRSVDLCGAYGDPIVASELLGIIRHLRPRASDRKVTVFTNGGVRPLAWWRELAEAIGPSGVVVFAIDGLEDTLSVYRRGVCFESVIERARAFIEAGGRARWDFLVFLHNEHEVKQARMLSQQLGFEEFCLKRSSRFLKSAYEYVPELEGRVDLEKFPIFDATGRQVGTLRPPRDPKLMNDTLLRYISHPEPQRGLELLFDRTAIRCRVQESRSVFVSASGQVFPCCWTYVQATTPVLYGMGNGIDTAMYDLVLATGGFEALDARTKGIAAVIEGPLFCAIQESWDKPSLAEGRQKVCARVCGQEFPAFDGQFTNDLEMPPACRPLTAEALKKVLPTPRIGFFSGAVPQELEPSGLLLCDPLTGLVAYPSFERYLVANLPDIAPFGLHISVGDVDGLKEYVTRKNAEDEFLFGHLAGNHCMQEVGRITRSWAHQALEDVPFSLCGTFGGDEVILAVAGIEYDRFVTAIRLLATKLRHEAPRPCSFAAATLFNRTVEQRNAHEIFRRLVSQIDRALFRYKAKLPGDAGGGDNGVVDVGTLLLSSLNETDTVVNLFE
ncbi:MAG: radical SAM protein [Nitrospira sp.]|nr:radical SAM protein [Nitrospira sp.]